MGGEPDEERCEEEGAAVIVNLKTPAMGVETAKQYNAAANLLQAWQQTLLVGDLTVPAITTDPNVKAVR